MMLQLWPQTDDDHIIVFSEHDRMLDTLTRQPDSLTDLIRWYEAVNNTQLLQQTDRTDHQQQQMIAEIGGLSHECKQLEASLMGHTGETCHLLRKWMSSSSSSRRPSVKSVQERMNYRST